MASDAEIIDAVRSGDCAAYAHLVRRYRRAVLGVALHVLGEFHGAEDAAQEAFIAAYRRLSTLRDPRRFRAWLLEIARTKAIDEARRRPRCEPLDEGTLVAPAARDPTLSDSSRRVLEALLDGLPARDRGVLVLKHLVGLSAREIGELTGRSTGTVTKHLSRAYARLRERLGRIDR